MTTTTTTTANVLQNAKDKIRGRPNFVFVFVPKNDDFSGGGFYFPAENRWRIFGFILFFGLIIPENCRKMPWADEEMKFGI